MHGHGCCVLYLFLLDLSSTKVFFLFVPSSNSHKKMMQCVVLFLPFGPFLPEIRDFGLDLDLDSMGFQGIWDSEIYPISRFQIQKLSQNPRELRVHLPQASCLHLICILLKRKCSGVSPTSKYGASILLHDTVACPFPSLYNRLLI